MATHRFEEIGLSLDGQPFGWFDGEFDTDGAGDIDSIWINGHHGREQHEVAQGSWLHQALASSLRRAYEDDLGRESWEASPKHPMPGAPVRINHRVG